MRVGHLKNDHIRVQIKTEDNSTDLFRYEVLVYERNTLRTSRGRNRKRSLVRRRKKRYTYSNIKMFRNSRTRKNELFKKSNKERTT